VPALDLVDANTSCWAVGRRVGSGCAAAPRLFTPHADTGDFVIS
jgi:hypothetical protein